MSSTTTLSGRALAGAPVTRTRSEHDFYATPFETTEAILDRVPLSGSILEPAAGQGHISTVLKRYYPNNEVVSTDLVYREDKFACDIQNGVDFLTYDFGRTFNNVITNPPFSLAREFIEKALALTTDKVIIFAKIQLLEGEGRRVLFDTTPLKYIYVFTRRQYVMKDGSPVDENGKRWQSTMCFAWFVWEHGYTGEPIVRRI